ncbi:hypothetical protein Tco_0290617 [Tanacetum coccineum]
MQGIATRLNYSSEDVDEEMEMEASLGFQLQPLRETKGQTMQVRGTKLRKEDHGKASRKGQIIHHHHVLVLLSIPHLLELSYQRLCIGNPGVTPVPSSAPRTTSMRAVRFLDDFLFLGGSGEAGMVVMVDEQTLRENNVYPS